MKITVKKITDISLMRKACSFTIGHESKAGLAKMYRSEHSPIRTQLFWIEMEDIPSFVSTHFVRHKIGVEHFVLSKRDDRGGEGDEKVNRNTLINHAMLINAQALINMARKRLCNLSHKKTQKVMNEIRKKIKEVDQDMSDYMVRECDYRNGYCPEIKSCRALK